MGSCFILFRPLSSYNKKEYFKTNSIYERCIYIGLQDSDMITYVQSFYPNGNVSENREFTCRGVGQQVLDEIIEDSISRTSRLIHAYATTESMKQFCKKVGCHNYEDFPKAFFLLIDQI